MNILYRVVCETKGINKPKGKQTEVIAELETADCSKAQVFGEQMQAMIAAESWKLPATVRVFASVITEPEEFAVEELPMIAETLETRAAQQAGNDASNASNPDDLK